MFVLVSCHLVQYHHLTAGAFAGFVCHPFIIIFLFALSKRYIQIFIQVYLHKTIVCVLLSLGGN